MPPITSMVAPKRSISRASEVAAAGGLPIGPLDSTTAGVRSRIDARGGALAVRCARASGRGRACRQDARSWVSVERRSWRRSATTPSRACSPPRARRRGADAASVAADESYWYEIQQAFTVDRSFINLNNGGVCPSPRIVQEAMKRYLDLSNEAPVYTMWQMLEPQIETVRRALAREFGCDPEEMAITRNASESLEIVQLGLDLKPGDEVLTTDPGLPAHADDLRASASAATASC